MNVELSQAGLHEKAIFRNMFELYMHDLSEFVDLELDEHGVYGYKFLDHYWTESNRFPYLVRVNGHLAGFALVRRMEDKPPRYIMAEFFIIRKYRLLGVGKNAAEQLFDRYPGRWMISEEIKNLAAQHFWYNVISDFTKGQFTRREEGQRVNVEFFAGGGMRT